MIQKWLPYLGAPAAVAHCASGGRAAVSLFTLELLGYPHIKIYYGSFADYSTHPDAPVEK